MILQSELHDTGAVVRHIQVEGISAERGGILFGVTGWLLLAAVFLVGCACVLVRERIKNIPSPIQFGVRLWHKPKWPSVFVRQVEYETGVVITAGIVPVVNTSSHPCLNQSIWGLADHIDPLPPGDIGTSDFKFSGKEDLSIMERVHQFGAQRCLLSLNSFVIVGNDQVGEWRDPTRHIDAKILSYNVKSYGRVSLLIEGNRTCLQGPCVVIQTNPWTLRVTSDAVSLNHRLPLPLGVGDVKKCQENDGDGSCRSNASVVSINEGKKPFERSADCYQRPHYVAAGLCSIAGILCLGLASGCWGAAERDISSARQGRFVILGLVCLACCGWFIYQAFQLAFFGVAPCASISLPHLFAFIAARAL